MSPFGPTPSMWMSSLLLLVLLVGLEENEAFSPKKQASGVGKENLFIIITQEGKESLQVKDCFSNEEGISMRPLIAEEEK